MTGMKLKTEKKGKKGRKKKFVWKKQEEKKKKKKRGNWIDRLRGGLISLQKFADSSLILLYISNVKEGMFEPRRKDRV